METKNLSLTTYRETCKNFYNFLNRNVRKYGLDKTEIERLSNKYIKKIKDKYSLSDDVFKPTGLALGVPLPSNIINKNFDHISFVINNYLNKIKSEQKNLFVKVPSEFLHITIVNRTHFAISNKIQTLTENEYDKLVSIVQENIKFQVAISLNGLILTQTGSIIIAGYFLDDKIFNLRKKISSNMPELSKRLPCAAYIKLGHLFHPIDNSYFYEFLSLLNYLSYWIHDILIFDSFYTPEGRIQINE